MTNPYQHLASKHFWKPAVASNNMFNIEQLWQSKFPITTQSKLVTFGSCFAQHLSKALTKQGFSWLNTEPAPKGLSVKNCATFNYATFSARTGNIYTTSLLRQWVCWALEPSKTPAEVWQCNNRYYDPFRPNIEPDGFASFDEMQSSRLETLTAFKAAVLHADYFIFTLGLTESWFNKQAGYEYPMCPGTIAGEFNSEQHEFKNQQFESIRQNLMAAFKLMRTINPNLKFILTVSPVPLTATNSPNHVLVATMESKSILRAVAGQVATNNDFVDYFPSYEIINSPVYKGVFFEPNQRNISQAGVKHVMATFFNGLSVNINKPSLGQEFNPEEAATEAEDDCEEALLAAFSTN